MSSEPESQNEEAPKRGSKPGAVLIGFLVLLIGEVIILSNSGVESPEMLPEAISTYAEGVDRLFYLILWITGFFFVLTETLLVYFCIKYRARDGEQRKSAHTHGNHTLELAWTFIPGLILFVLAVLQTGTWGSIKYTGGFPAEEDSVVVQVMAKQFEWHFRYAGKDGKFGTEDDATSLENLHVPVNRNVIVKLRTMDVLHSFWIRNARLKQDTVPGLTIPQWFNVYKTGTFEIACAELCGIGHTRMMGKLIVETQEEFDAWLEKQAEDFAYDSDKSPFKHWRD